MEVVQNYVYDVNGELVKQIKKELQASYVYQAYVSYRFYSISVECFGKKIKNTFICIQTKYTWL